MDPHGRKQALRMFTNGMYILTSRSGDQYGAATVTWVSQASFKPPLLMTAVRRDSNVFRCLSESRIAAVHVLAEDQRDLAKRFFTPTQASNGTINGEPFVEGATTAPVLPHTPANVECRVQRILDDAGDHAIVILEVVEATVRREARPLTIGESPWEYGG